MHDFDDSELRLALVSLDQAWEDKEENLRRCTAAAERAVALGARVVVFPEMTLTGFTMNATYVVESPADSWTIRAFSSLARELRIAIAFGVVLRGERLPANCMVVVGRDGEELGRYAKMHPFSHALEDTHYEGGSRLGTASIDGTRFGLTICYDLRFPELYSVLAPGCAVLLVIANWPEARIGDWNTLLAARAIDGQCYVVAVNRTGEDGNGIRYPRSSRVMDPRGRCTEPDAVDGVIETFTIDARAVERWRRAFPTLRDRRPALYAELLAGSVSRPVREAPR